MTLPAVDFLSWTHAGQPWTDFEWLTQLLAYALYCAGGLTALWAFKTLVFAAVSYFLWKTLSLYNAKYEFIWALPLFAAAVSVLADWRADNSTVLFFAVLIYLLEKLRLAQNPPQKIPRRALAAFCMSNRFGLVGRYGDTDAVPVYEKYFIGGADTVRGYSSSGQVGDPDGGQIYYVMNTEIRFPLAREKRRTIIQGAFFYDLGSSWNKFSDITPQIGSGQDMLMANSHIGHDGRVGNGVVMVNGTGLAGHVHVEDKVIISGLCGVHQFGRIGTMSAGDFVVFLGAFFAIYGPLKNIANANPTLQLGLVCWDRILQLLDEKPTVVEIQNPKKIQKLAGKIVFEDLTYKYPTGALNALNGLNLTIEPGQAVAFVGASGSGKTTIINLLLRLFDPVAGRITYDGDDLRVLELGSLRNHIGLVSQTTILFDDTVFANIALGRPDATLEEVQEACCLSCAVESSSVMLFLAKSFRIIGSCNAAHPPRSARPV